MPFSHAVDVPRHRTEALKAAFIGQRAGGDDHHVGAEGFHFGRFHGGIKTQVHLVALELTLVPVQEIEDLRPAGLHPGQPELPADLIRGLGQGDPMAPGRRRPGGFQAAGAGTDDEHAPRRQPPA